MNALEANSTTRSATPLPEPGARLEVAPGVRWVRMPLPFALDHINLWLLRDRGRRRPRRAGRIVDCGIANDGDARRLGAGLRDRARRPAGAARDRHAHAPGPHRPARTGCASAGTCRLWISATDWQRRAHGERSAPPASAASARPRSWPSHGLAPTARSVGEVAARGNYYTQPGARRCRRSYRRLLGRQPCRDRRGADARLALHRRLRPRARAHRAALRARSAC